ncbi:EmrB/QacA subfamily drug resistance transporter [Kineosphaera limosa]|uniref:Putative drug resistance protein n=1 Tax=Kineosphaera limosa NBRC 100340 TaxID=1184609 RepID=K6VM79_9MICO|nr:MDR family MFS transporter [Kineosphaera limosa]NYE01632.1 EmrB/QacA subfamily drug resistance transporter [Kineosphaera limosa]GAB97293.1 putative drug resistance protein [Kineosphaera limosa NBRC 100340]
MTTDSYELDRAGQRVFLGLMLGMFVAAVSQTIVSPAMPRIVAELGGMDHYSWLATAAMLVSAVAVPIVGKLSDLYGRRRFYLGGLLLFMLGSVLAGMAQNFWFLVFARAVQGAGMGTLMPLSQTIIGDIIPPRQRGKYQGMMGAVFGVTSITGPLIGGFVTDHWGWRWLFFITLPIGVLAFAAIYRFLRLPHTRREAKVDVAGIVTLTIALVLLLLATSFGGTTYAWGSVQIIATYVVGAFFLAAFIAVETRAAEPIIPLRLFRSSIFVFSNLATFAVSMMMFGALIYIPVYAQGVLGVGATESGLILMPMNVGMIGLSILSGLFITRTGHYKELVLLGPLIMGAGLFLLTRLDYGAGQFDLTLAMVVFGVGLGMCMQVYTLIVQNASTRSDLGVATASTQFFRNVGSTVGIAVFGTILTSRMGPAIATHLPAEAAAGMPAGGVDAGSVLDPSALAQLPPAVAQAVRYGLADALHYVFLAALPLALVALIASALIKVLPLRDTVHTADEEGREMLDTLGQSASGGELAVPLGRDEGASRTRERLLGLQLSLLCDQAVRDDRPLLARAFADIGDGDFDRGLALVSRTAAMLTTEDHAVAARSERYAAQVGERGARRGGALSPGLRRELATAAAALEPNAVMTRVEPTVADCYEAVDVSSLHAVGNDITAALLVDLRRARDGE